MRRQKVIPLLAPPLRKSLPHELGCLETKARGMAVLTTPLLNKGTAFTAEEREALGLTGLLPPVSSTLDAQVMAAYAQYQRLPDALSKNVYLTVSALPTTDNSDNSPCLRYAFTRELDFKCKTSRGLPSSVRRTWTMPRPASRLARRPRSRSRWRSACSLGVIRECPTPSMKTR